MSAAAAAAASRTPAPRAAVLPVLRDVRFFNEHQLALSSFDADKLGFATPPKDASGKVTFYKDGMDNIVVPFTYDGRMAMNYGWIVRNGKFDFVKAKAKDAKADAYQLQANFPVVAPGEAYDSADLRKASMHAFMSMLLAVEDKARSWILADKEGSMFGVPYSASDLEPKARLDGKVEKGKFNTVVKSGTTAAGVPMLLKAYFKMPTDATELKVYADLSLNGTRLDPTVPNFLDNVTWAKDVSLLFSLRDMIRSSQGISVRIRIDAVGAYEAPKVHIPVTNPFLTGGGAGAGAGSQMEEDD